jgi:hypothetical protein
VGHGVVVEVEEAAGVVGGGYGGVGGEERGAGAGGVEVEVAVVSGEEGVGAGCVLDGDVGYAFVLGGDVSGGVGGGGWGTGFV